MRKIWVILLFLNIFLFGMGNQEEAEDYEEGIIYLRINQRYGDTFFPVLFRGQGKEVYVDMEEFFMLAGLQNIEIDQEKMIIKGELFFWKDSSSVEVRKIERDIGDTKFIKKEGRIYIEAVNLSRALPMEDVVWERERYFLDVKLGFVMPIEIRSMQERKMNELLSGKGVSEEKNIIRNEKRIFSPGVAQLKYTRTDFLDNGDKDYFGIDYYNQLLYGDFQMQTTITPDSDIDYANLKYKEVLGDNSIILGDSYLQQENPVRLDGDRFRGISMVKDEVFIDRDSDRDTITIEGRVLNGTTVELYQRINLVDIQRVRTDNMFRFEDVPVMGTSEEYILKFFYPDGSYEERVVRIKGGMNLQNKGESDYYIQVGEMESELTFSGNYLYGVTDNLTLGVGYLRGEGTQFVSTDDEDEDDEDDNEEEFEFEGTTYTYSAVETDIIYRTKAKKSPTIYSLKVFTDIDEDESDYYSGNEQTSRNTYIGEIEKEIFNQELTLFWDEYSRTIANSEGNNRAYGVGIGSNIYRLNYNLSYQREEGFAGDLDRYRLNLTYFLGGNTRIGFDNSYYDYSYDEEDYIRSRLSISYSGFQSINLNLNLTTEIRDGGNEETYEVRISKKNRSLGKGDLDYSAFARYNSDEWEYGIGIEYFFTNWLSTPALVTDDNYEIGLTIDKTIILSDPLRKDINPDPQDAWIEGRVFLDTNGNGIYDEGEQIMEGVRFKNRRSEVTSDNKGYFFLSDVPSDTVYPFSVDMSSIDPMLKPFNEDQNLLLDPAMGHYLDVPLMPVSALVGYVTFVDEESLSPREKAIAYNQTRVYLKKDGKIIMEDSVEVDGFYLLEDVLPGIYHLEVKYLGNRDFTVEEKVYEVDITAGEMGEFYEGYDFHILSNEAPREKEMDDQQEPEKVYEVRTEETDEEETIKPQVKNYIIKPGDTLSELAIRKNIPITRILEKNEWIKNPDLIWPERKIIIPDYVYEEPEEFIGEEL